MDKSLEEKVHRQMIDFLKNSNSFTYKEICSDLQFSGIGEIDKHLLISSYLEIFESIGMIYKTGHTFYSNN